MKATRESICEKQRMLIVFKAGMLFDCLMPVQRIEAHL